MKKVIRAAWEGIRTSAIVFMIYCIILGLRDGREVFANGTGMALSCIAAFAIGAIFGIASLIYGTELPTWLKVLIHMGVGITSMLVISIAVGWIDFSRGWKACLLTAAVQIAVAFIAWAFDCLSIKNLAKKMNERMTEEG